MNTRALLRELELRPHKELGQNFLVDAQALLRILDAAQVGAADTVLEIGSGLGILTQALAERARRVIGVEIDKQLVSALRQRLGSLLNLEIVQGDILTMDIAGLVRDRDGGGTAAYKVVANIPYYITSAVLRQLLEARRRPELVVLMVQKEVAQRIAARPGQMSLLAVSVQFYGHPRILSRVPARSFYPVPKVDSAIVRVDPHQQLPLPEDHIAGFFEVVRAGFGQRRKQLRNALVHGLNLPAERIANALTNAGIDGERRAQTLSIAEWVVLYQALSLSSNEGQSQKTGTGRAGRPS